MKYSRQSWRAYKPTDKLFADYVFENYVSEHSQFRPSSNQRTTTE